MSPSTNPASTSALPPLPDLNKGGMPGGGPQDPMAAVMAGVAPVKQGVDLIMKGCQMVVASGAVPGVEQGVQQVIAMATSWLPMAVQQAMTPQGPAPVGAPAPPQQGPPSPVGA